MARHVCAEHVEWRQFRRGMSRGVLVRLRECVLAARVEHRGDDLGIGAAAAEVAAQRVVDFVKRGLRRVLQQRRRNHDKAAGAEAALQRVVLHERALDGV